MQEETLFDDPRAKVTTARVVLNGVTYSMANITSVRCMSDDRPALLAILGLVALLVGFYLIFDPGSQSGGLGMLSIAAGAAVIIAFFRSKPNHWVRIGTAGAEQNAVASQDLDWTNAVVNAVSQAMVTRG